MSTPPKLTVPTNDDYSQALSQSIPRRLSIAEASIARDLAARQENMLEDEPRSSSGLDVTGYSLAGSWRRPSVINIGRPAMLPVWAPEPEVTEEERRQALREQAKLLRDNGLIAPEVAGQRRGSIVSVLGLSGRRESYPANEDSPLLGDREDVDAATVSQAWEKAVAEGKIATTWQREAKVVLQYSLPLMVTFLLQYSLTVASVLAVGHIGVTELGAVSIAGMTANITGYMIYQGLATSLDTLCAQAYGSGRKELVGLQMQRMILFLWLVTIPIGIVWLLSDKILAAILPANEAVVSDLAGLYLKIVLAGAPGYATFEAGKRYVQAQGMFLASMHVLFVCAPFNAFLNWLLVWKLNFGFKGAPTAVAITNNLLPLGLWIYVRFLSKDGMSCWGGFSRRALSNWGPMIKLAIPGMIMVEAEFMAFEALTFGATHFGTTVLGAQSVLSSLVQLAYQIPFSLSIAGATRVANLIGATLVDTAKLSSKVTLAIAMFVGIFNMVILGSLRHYLPRVFTSDPAAIAIAASVLPICAPYQLFDSLAAYCNGMLRALGRQEFGGYMLIFSYYAIGIPFSFGTGFGLGWQLKGFWAGIALALVTVTIVESIYVFRIVDWNKSVEEAQKRNRAEEATTSGTTQHDA